MPWCRDMDLVHGEEGREVHLHIRSCRAHVRALVFIVGLLSNIGHDAISMPQNPADSEYLYIDQIHKCVRLYSVHGGLCGAANIPVPPQT